MKELPVTTLQRLFALSRMGQYGNDVRRVYRDLRWIVRDKRTLIAALSSDPGSFVALRRGLEIVDKLGADIDRPGWWEQSESDSWVMEPINDR